MFSVQTILLLVTTTPYNRPRANFIEEKSVCLVSKLKKTVCNGLEQKAFVTTAKYEHRRSSQQTIKSINENAK